MSELDSTYALLSSNLPVGGDPSSVKKTKKSKEEQPVVHVDSDEDEVFFGEKTYKELNGKNSKETVRLGNATTMGKNVWMDYRTMKYDSIDEESVASIKSAIIEEENEENVDPKETEEPILKEPVVPSPRKINIEKNLKDRLEVPAQNIATQFQPSPRKRDEEKLKATSYHLSPSAIKTPPRKILHDDHETSDEESILDINNDQMFDDSIFTEYDAGNLSCMSSKMTKKWRKKWEKEDTSKNKFTADTIDRLVKKQQSLIVEETADLVLKEDVPEEDLNNASTCSDWFNTTRDEMILFEKFGEEYDDIVNKMNRDEKSKLRKEVDNCVPKSAEELFAMHQSNEMLPEQKSEELKEDIFSPQPIPKPRTMTPKKESPPKTPTIFRPQNSAPSTLKKLFKSPGSLHNSPNYLRPTTASKLRMSPRKNDVYLSPGVQPCPRAGFVKSPEFSNKHKSLKKVMASGIDMDKVVSPVGQYIRSNPVPPIIRQIRPKATKHFDDDLAAFERDEELCKTPPSLQEKRLFKPIPMAEYKPSRVALEQEAPTKTLLTPLPKVFGLTPTVQATVVRHVGRQRIPKDSEFLQQDSPKGTLVFNKPDPTRESIMPDATTEFMDMSIRQVVELKKMTSNYSK